ncbi:hypothetical protein [Streptomyces sp. NPDC056512]|uniref:hypothetical protein n=1 Tax=Streptomyces sp. NPDC056512 TaxID=3345846 RepID=UPI003695E19E
MKPVKPVKPKPGDGRIIDKTPDPCTLFGGKPCPVAEPPQWFKDWLEKQLGKEEGSKKPIKPNPEDDGGIPIFR